MAARWERKLEMQKRVEPRTCTDLMCGVQLALASETLRVHRLGPGM